MTHLLKPWYGGTKQVFAATDKQNSEQNQQNQQTSNKTNTTKNPNTENNKLQTNNTEPTKQTIDAAENKTTINPQQTTKACDYVTVLA